MNQKQKIKIAKEWVKALTEEEPGEFWIENDDMIVLKEALQLWLSDHKSSDIKFFVNGIEHKLTPMEEE